MLSYALRHIIWSNHGFGRVTWSAVFWVMLKCLVSLFFKSLWYVISSGIMFLVKLLIMSSIGLSGYNPNSSFSLSFFLSPCPSSYDFLLFRLTLSPPPLSVCLKAHIHSLSVSGEIPADQRKWSHFLLILRGTLHHTHTQTMFSAPTFFPLHFWFTLTPILKYSKTLKWQQPHVMVIQYLWKCMCACVL